LQNLPLKKSGDTQKGEEQLVHAFNTYYEKVYNYFSCRIHNHEQAQDLTGEVFYKVAAAWPRYDPVKGAVSTWIFNIARNLLSDYWRKKRHIQVELEEISDGSRDLAEHLEMEESKRRPRDALLTLSEREQEILSLKYSADLKNTEIATLTGLSQTNVGIILFRTVRKLREKLKKDQA